MATERYNKPSWPTKMESSSPSANPAALYESLYGRRIEMGMQIPSQCVVLH